MTKYPSDKKNSQAGWNKDKTNNKWRNYLAIFLVVVLGFAAFNGLLKTINISKYFSQNKSFSGPTVLVALSTNPASLAVFLKDLNKIVVMKLDPNFHLVTGHDNNPIKVLAEISKDKNGPEIQRVMALAFRTNVDKYVVFQKNEELETANVQKLFKGFASITTPVKILINKDGLANTNLTRIDLFRLWWQAKSLRINDVNLVDLSAFSEDILNRGGNKVLGADEDQFNREIKKYTEIPDVISEHREVKIVNASGVDSTVSLAGGFVNSIGADVGDVRNQNQVYPKTQVIVNGDNSATAKYLASMFNCDIKRLPQDSGTSQITVFVGQDFADKYFK